MSDNTTKHTCKDCLHGEMCLPRVAVGGDKVCESFKDKSLFIEISDTYNVGDICLYPFHKKNKSRAIVEIVRLLDNSEAAEVKFIKVFNDDTGNNYLNYLLKTGKTMNASLKYMKNITPLIKG